MKKLLIIGFLIALMSAIGLYGTLLIDPAGGGGFELGSTFTDNGWTVVNSTSGNYFYVGNAPVQNSGTNCAFVSSSPTAWTAGTASTYRHIYRDITFPVGETDITLTFYYKMSALDSGYDGFKVYLAATTYTPVATGYPTGTQIGNTWYDSSTSWLQQTITVPASNAGTTKRLVFTFRGDGYSPATVGALDDISLTSASQENAPAPSAIVSPTNAATNVMETATLNWAASSLATSYKLYFGTDNPPTNIVNGTDIGNVTTYDPAGNMLFGQIYYWQVVPTNVYGDATGCPLWSFTTRPDPTVSTFPTVWDFGTLGTDPFPPTNWTKHSGVLASPTVLGAAGTGSWIQDDWKNTATPANKAAKINIYGTLNGWLISPPIAVPANDYEVKFDVAYMAWGNNNAPGATGTDDQFIVLVGDGSSWTPANIVRQWDNAGSPYVLNNIPPAGVSVSLPLGTAGTKYVAFYGISTVSNADNDLMVDNIEIRQTPAVPIFGYTPSSIAFGDAVLDRPTPWSNVTVSNTGGSTLNLAAGDISIIGTDAALFEFDASNLPAALTVGQSVTIPVRMTADSEGAKSATLRMTYNSVDYDVALSGNGLPEGIIPIGNGTSVLRIPIHPYFNYSYSQSLFLQSEIAVPDQRIEKVKYYWNGYDEATASNDWVIYMGHTAKTVFNTTTDWIPVANMTQVFSGEVALPATAGWVEITLDTPFIYNNTDNLVIAVEENEADCESSSDYAFFGTPTAGNRSILYYADATNPDPTAPPAGSLVAGYPNVQLQLSDIPTGPPLPVVMGNPANEATGLAKAGFNFTWSLDPLSGPIDYYAFFLSTDDQDLYGQFYGETTGNSFNPVGQPYGDGTFAFDYSTRYYWQVIAYQGAEEAASDVRWFEIEADPNAPIVSYPYVVDFEAHAGNTLPSGWSRTSNATGWQVGTSLGSSYWSIPAHTVYAAANDDAAGSAGDGSMDLLISPYLDFTGDYEGIPLLTFDSYYTGSYGQLANVEISTDGENWTNLYTVMAGTTWESLTVSLADYDGMDGLKIRFHADDAGEWASGWAVDNIGIDFVNIDLMAPIVNHYPVIGWPVVGNDIPIVAEAYDDLTWNSGITSVTLEYSVDGGDPVSVPMTLVEGLYEAVIPAQAAGSWVDYSITAVDASAQENVYTTDVWDFEVNSPVWMTYDANTITSNLGLSSGTFGIMTGFDNPFGAGNPMQINSIFARSLYATSANVHVYVYDGVNNVFVDIIPSFSQSFLAATDTTIPLTGCTTTAGIIYVALTDIPGGNYFALDGTQAYYPGTHFVHIGAGMTTANLGTVEGSGFPGSWLLRANMEAGTSALDAPVVTITNEVDGPTLAWDPIAGANSYNIYGSADPYADPFSLITSVGSSPYLYTGSEGYMFFQVTASSDGLPSKTATISSRVNQLRSMVSNRKVNQAPKAAVK